MRSVRQLAILKCDRSKAIGKGQRSLRSKVMRLDELSAFLRLSSVIDGIALPVRTIRQSLFRILSRDSPDAVDRFRHTLRLTGTIETRRNYCESVWMRSAGYTQRPAAI